MSKPFYPNLFQKFNFVYEIAQKKKKKRRKNEKKFQNNPSITRSLYRLECAARDNYEIRRVKRTDVETQPDRIGRNGGRDIDRGGYAVIGGTCLPILQSIIERHCHVNGNRIEIGMEMATNSCRTILLSFSRASSRSRSRSIWEIDSSSPYIFSVVILWYPSGGVLMN